MWALATAVFFLLNLFPGGPFDDDLAVDPRIRHLLEEHYRLSGSAWDRYLSFLGSCLQGDFGSSVYFSNQSVASLLRRGFLTTASLNLSAVVGVVGLSLVFAVGAHGVPRLAAVIRSLERLGLALPNLFLAPLAIWLLCFHWSWFPLRADGSWPSLVLPVFLLAFRPACGLARQLDLSLGENLRQDFARTHRSQGVSEFRLLWRWCLRASLPVFVQELPPLVAGLLSGSLLIEVLFSVSGLGLFFTESLLNRDWGLALGLALFFGSLLVVLQMVADTLTMLLDPRVRIR